MATMLPPLKKHQQLAAGGIAGISEILCMYPLDVIKTRAQLSTSASKDGMLRILANTVRTEGFGVYRGILPPILVEAPKRAIKFAANETYKPMWARDGVLGRGGAIGAGVCAGLTEAFVVVPFELVKIRLQAKENAGLYKSTFDATYKIIKSEGPLALYKGLESTLWRHATWNGGYFGVIFSLRAAMPKAESDGQQLLFNFCTGSVAGTFGTMLNTPFDVVKSRIQNQVVKPGAEPKYTWTLPGVVSVAREEGVRALYKGFLPKVVRLGPGGGILLLVFDRLSVWFRKKNAEEAERLRSSSSS